MNLLLELVRDPAAGLLGEVLLHFLWQGTLVALMLAVMLGALRRASAGLRYQVACVALAVMTALPVVTWLWLAQGGGGAERPTVASAVSLAAPASDAPVLVGTSLMNFWRGWIPVVWLAGMLGFGVRLLGGWWQSQRLRDRDVKPLEDRWGVRLQELAALLGIQRPVQLLESARVQTPMLLGWLRPVILVPVGFVTSLSLAEVDAILAHELAHLRRHDYLVNLVQRLIETVLFYHPAVWWVSQCIRVEREHCCDDLAAAAVGDRRVVAQALVSLAENSLGLPAFALAADGGSLGERVRRLLGVKPEGEGKSLGKKLATAVVLLLLVVGGYLAVPSLLAPKLYVAVGRLRLNAPTVLSGEKQPGGYDPFYIQTEFEVIGSRSTLALVVEKTGLEKAWAKAGEAPLAREEAVQLLRERMRVMQYRNTSLVQIEVGAPDAKQAAELANTIMAVYLEQKQDRHAGRAMEKYRTLRQESEERELAVRKAQDQVRRYQAETANNVGPEIRQAEAMLKRQAELSQEAYEDVLKQLRDVDLESKSRLQDVDIIDQAVPPLKARRWRP